MKKIGMVFSGYRSEFVGMGKDIYDHYRSVQELFEEVSNCLDTNFVKLCFASSDTEIRKVHNAYLTLFITQVSIVNVLRQAGINPVVVAGVDVGEYSAVYTAGGLTFVDALYFITKYTAAYEAIITSEKYGQLLVTECSREVVEAACSQVTDGDEFALISVYESPTRFLISGTLAALADLKKNIKAHNGVVAKLALGSGFHSFIMDEVVKVIKMYLEKIDVKSLNIPFVSGAIGQTLTEGEVVLASLMQHIHAPSHVESIIPAFEECDVILQIGPGDWLLPLFASVFHEKTLYTVQNLNDIERCIKELV